MHFGEGEPAVWQELLELKDTKSLNWDYTSSSSRIRQPSREAVVRLMEIQALHYSIPDVRILDEDTFKKPNPVLNRSLHTLIKLEKDRAEIPVTGLVIPYVLSAAEKALCRAGITPYPMLSPGDQIRLFAAISRPPWKKLSIATYRLLINDLVRGRDLPHACVIRKESLKGFVSSLLGQKLDGIYDFLLRSFPPETRFADASGHRELEDRQKDSVIPVFLNRLGYENIGDLPWETQKKILSHWENIFWDYLPDSVHINYLWDMAALRRRGHPRAIRREDYLSPAARRKRKSTPATSPHPRARKSAPIRRTDHSADARFKRTTLRGGFFLNWRRIYLQHYPPGFAGTRPRLIDFICDRLAIPRLEDMPFADQMAVMKARKISRWGQVPRLTRRLLVHKLALKMKKKFVGELLARHFKKEKVPGLGRTIWGLFLYYAAQYRKTKERALGRKVDGRVSNSDWLALEPNGDKHVLDFMIQDLSKGEDKFQKMAAGTREPKTVLDPLQMTPVHIQTQTMRQSRRISVHRTSLASFRRIATDYATQMGIASPRLLPPEKILRPPKHSVDGSLMGQILTAFIKGRRPFKRLARPEGVAGQRINRADFLEPLWDALKIPVPTLQVASLNESLDQMRESEKAETADRWTSTPPDMDRFFMKALALQCQAGHVRLLSWEELKEVSLMEWGFPLNGLVEKYEQQHAAAGGDPAAFTVNMLMDMMGFPAFSILELLRCFEGFLSWNRTARFRAWMIEDRIQIYRFLRLSQFLGVAVTTPGQNMESALAAYSPALEPSMTQFILELNSAAFPQWPEPLRRIASTIPWGKIQERIGHFSGQFLNAFLNWSEGKGPAPSPVRTWIICDALTQKIIVVPEDKKIGRERIELSGLPPDVRYLPATIQFKENGSDNLYIDVKTEAGSYRYLFRSSAGLNRRMKQPIVVAHDVNVNGHYKKPSVNV